MKPRDKGLCEVAALLLILGAAFALRVWRLGELPAGLSHDEAYDALNAIDILNGQRPVFFEANNGREPLFMYLVSVFFRALGVGSFQLRLVSALSGTLAIGLTYCLSSRLFGRSVAVVGAGLMALSFWTIFDSRLGLRESLFPAVVVLCVYATWRWFEDDPPHLVGWGCGWNATRRSLPGRGWMATTSSSPR